MKIWMWQQMNRCQLCYPSQFKVVLPYPGIHLAKKALFLPKYKEGKDKLVAKKLQTMRHTLTRWPKKQTKKQKQKKAFELLEGIIVPDLLIFLKKIGRTVFG